MVKRERERATGRRRIISDGKQQVKPVCVVSCLSVIPKTERWDGDVDVDDPACHSLYSRDNRNEPAGSSDSIGW